MPTRNLRVHSPYYAQRTARAELAYQWQRACLSHCDRFRQETSHRANWFPCNQTNCQRGHLHARYVSIPVWDEPMCAMVPHNTIVQPHAISGFTFFGPFPAWAAWLGAHLRPAAWLGGPIGWNRAILGTCLGLLARLGVGACLRGCLWFQGCPVGGLGGPSSMC